MSPTPCRLCGEGTAPFRTPDGAVYHECPACGFVGLEEERHPTVEAARERYLQHQNFSTQAGYVAMLDKFIESCVSPFAATGDAILDFGCGPEPVLMGLLDKRGYRADAYDPLFRPDESYRGRAYDLVVLTEVLEHLTDPLETLQDILPVLKPGGHLAAQTLFRPAGREAFGEWWYRRDSTHVSFFNQRSAETLGKALGLGKVWSDGKQWVVWIKE